MWFQEQFVVANQEALRWKVVVVEKMEKMEKMEKVAVSFRFVLMRKSLWRLNHCFHV